MIQVSATIITYNEERNIARCIRSLQQVADEIIVVDSFSTDNTIVIAETLGARVIQHAFNGYGEQKHFAVTQAKHDWVLNIDADEALSPELEQNLLSLKKAPDCDAYRCNILTSYCGKWIHHCGWYPASKMRFWNKTQGHMTTDKVHEGWVIDRKDARIGWVQGDLHHYSYYTISDHMRKIEHYSEMGARFDVYRGKRCSLLKLLFVPQWEFFKIFILHLGLLDGYYGYVISRNSAYASFVKYLKIRQYNRFKKEGKPF